MVGGVWMSTYMVGGLAGLADIISIEFLIFLC